MPALLLGVPCWCSLESLIAVTVVRPGSCSMERGINPQVGRAWNCLVSLRVPDLRLVRRHFVHTH
jgi:hypothetical protein